MRRDVDCLVMKERNSKREKLRTEGMQKINWSGILEVQRKGWVGLKTGGRDSPEQTNATSYLSLKEIV